MTECTLTNYDIADPEKNINSTFRRDYTRKCNPGEVKNNKEISKEGRKKKKEKKNQIEKLNNINYNCGRKNINYIPFFLI